MPPICMGASTIVVFTLYVKKKKTQNQETLIFIFTSAIPL